MQNLPSVERLRERLSYDPATGILTWLSVESLQSRIKVGDEAGFFDANGYRCIKLDGKKLYAHRVIWKLMTGQDPVNQIDHRDCDKGNNRWDNLREATPSENARNVRQPSHSRSPYKGVTWHKGDKKWQASITVDGRKRYLGSFKTAEDAAAAYRGAAQRIYGEFARAA